VLLLETAEAVLEVGADDEGVLLEPLLLEHLEDGEPAGGAQRVAAERVEVAAPGQHLRDLRRRHHGAQRDAVADALKNPGVRPGSERRRRWHRKTSVGMACTYLCHGHYVGDDAVGLEAPEVAADAGETRLDLVGDAEPAGLPDLVVRQRQVARRHLHDSAHALYGAIPFHHVMTTPSTSRREEQNQLPRHVSSVIKCTWMASDMKPATWPVVPNSMISCTSRTYFSASEPKAPL
jgi:hypothetical protein